LDAAFTGDARDIDDTARALLDDVRTIDDAPISDRCPPSDRLRGEANDALALARALALQAAALHGPADLRIVVATTESASRRLGLDRVAAPHT
jgi:hypothetical protein